MFTGLVQDVGTVAAREGCRLTIATALPGLALGDSVACAGCCLTVVEVGATLTKSDVWSYEEEWRIVSGMRDKKKDHEIITFYRI
jgi:riboflavin synthase alpha subunit